MVAATCSCSPSFASPERRSIGIPAAGSRSIHGGDAVASGILTCLAAILLVSPQADPKPFFRKPSTWREKIPANPKLHPDSRQYVKRVVQETPVLTVSSNVWSVPVWISKADTPKVTVQVTDKRTAGETILKNEWNRNVPIPRGARAASKADGHCVIVSHDRRWAWDMYQGRPDLNPPRARRIKRWDLHSNGIDQPYSGGGCRVAPVPLLQGLIMHEEIKAGRITHALAFAYGGSAKRGSRGVYPCVSSNSGNGEDRWSLWLGFRFQLDPAIDVTKLGLKPVGVVIARALQEYGMIFVENNGPGNNSVYAEDLEHDPNRSWKIGSLAGIPLNRLRLVEPIIHPVPEKKPGGR